jgi:hypothetical protein
MGRPARHCARECTRGVRSKKKKVGARGRGFYSSSFSFSTSATGPALPHTYAPHERPRVVTQGCCCPYPAPRHGVRRGGRARPAPVEYLLSHRPGAARLPAPPPGGWGVAGSVRAEPGYRLWAGAAEREVRAEGRVEQRGMHGFLFCARLESDPAGAWHPGCAQGVRVTPRHGSCMAR